MAIEIGPMVASASVSLASSFEGTSTNPETVAALALALYLHVSS